MWIWQPVPPLLVLSHAVDAGLIDALSQQVEQGKVDERAARCREYPALDEFRAAAVEQLATWGERVGVEVVRGPEGTDPASVAFEAVKALR